MRLALALIGLLPVAGQGVMTWEQLADAGNGWRESAWFGHVYPGPAGGNWNYHAQHGWVWLQGPGETNCWWWEPELGWTWSARGVYPHVFHQRAGEWLYYQGGSKSPRWYFSVGLGEWLAFGGARAASGWTTPETASGVASLALPVMVSLSDGTHVEMPPLNQAVAVTVGRESADWQFGSNSGIVPSGAARTIEVVVTPGLDPDLVTPLIAIPLAEAGRLAPETLNVVRIETIANGDGTTREEQTMLPVSVRGGLIVARDYMMPETMIRGLLELGQTAAVRSLGAIEDGRSNNSTRRTVRYLACSFEGSLNYNRPGHLVRVIPQPGAPVYRVPYYQASSELRAMDDGKLPHNIVVLVHGHNEEEKDGIGRMGSAPAPWFFAYKRDVWSQYFRYLQSDYFTNQVDDSYYMSLERTTRFYEFVYPSYRGIFNDLDHQLAESMQRELAPLLEPGIPFNLVMIAHSMGGLVARAAIQQFPDDLDDRFKELITWGTPHLGSPLVTLRYVLGADLAYNFGADDPLTLANLSMISGVSSWTGPTSMVLKSVIRRLMAHVQMDAPGTRDLRYVRRPQQETTYRLGLERLFHLSPAQQTPEQRQKYDLQSGSAIYNFNLQIMNQNDRHAGSNRYLPVIGKTANRVTIEPTDSFPWFRLDNVELETAQGATIMPLLVADPDEETWPPTRTASVGTAAESDGAVNVPSMAAVGISNFVFIGTGFDHEQYYGAPYADGTLRSPTAGRNMATSTIARSKGGSNTIEHDKYGLMPVPRMGYRIGYSRNHETINGRVTVDVGYARDFDLVMNINYNQFDELLDAPFSILDRVSLSLVPDAEGPRAPTAQSFTLSNPQVAPSELPDVNRTGGTFVGTSQYAPDNPRIFSASVQTANTDLHGKTFHVCLHTRDGTGFFISPPFKILKRPPQGTWPFELFLQNKASGNGAVAKNFDDLPIQFDASGHAAIDLEFGSILEPEKLPSDLLGEFVGDHWQLQGTASLINNEFRIELVIAMTYAFLSRQMVFNHALDRFEPRTVIRHKDAMFEISVSGMLENWHNASTFRLLPDSVTKTSGFVLVYSSDIDVGGAVVENIYQEFSGDDFTVIPTLRLPR